MEEDENDQGGREVLLERHGKNHTLKTVDGSGIGGAGNQRTRKGQ